MSRHVAAVGLAISTLVGSIVLAGDNVDERLADAVVREAREIIATELFGHYDIASLTVASTEIVPSPVEPSQDYALATAVVAFSAKRNATKSPSLNPAMFEPGSPMCQDWLYLHCGVRVGAPLRGEDPVAAGRRPRRNMASGLTALALEALVLSRRLSDVGRPAGGRLRRVPEEAGLALAPSARTG